MLITSLEDMRNAITQMAKTNRLSVTALNDLADVAKGSLNRFMRTNVRARRGPKQELTAELVPTDLRIATMLKIVEAAGYEVVIQPKNTKTRRQQVLEAARDRGTVNEVIQAE